MTATTPTIEEPTAPPPGPPSRGGPVWRFVAAVLVITGVLAALAGSGAVNPRVATDTAGTGIAAQSTFAYQVVEITNRGWLAIDIGNVSWATRGLSEPQVRLGAPNHPDWGPSGNGLEVFQTSVPFAPFKLGAGEGRTVVVTGWIRCAAQVREISVSTQDLVIEVRPAAGPTRTVAFEVGSGAGMRAPCPAPAG